MEPQALDEAVKGTLRILKQATTKQIVESVGKTYPPANRHRVLRILKESDFAESRVGEVTVEAKTGPYRKTGQLWAYKSPRRSGTDDSPDAKMESMNKIWPRLVYQSRLRGELEHIRERLDDESSLDSIDYEVWTEHEPAEKRTLIASDKQYKAIEHFYTTLNARNNYPMNSASPDERYRHMTEKCKNAYERIQQTLFFDNRRGQSRTKG